MAKKSAKSKGYRKTIEKKPYLSKRDIILLCALLAVVAVGAIMLFSYDDGALKVKDGRIADAGDNWVVVNGASRGGHRYFKLGEVGDMEGYTREAEPVTGDENLTVYHYTPESVDAGVKSVTISGAAAKPQRVAEYYRSLVTNLDVSEVEKDKVGDVEYTYFTYKAAPGEDTGDAEAPEEDAADAEAAEAAEAGYEQAIHAYFDAPKDYSVGIGVQVQVDSEEGYLSDDDLKAIVAQAWQAVTLEAK